MSTHTHTKDYDRRRRRFHHTSIIFHLLGTPIHHKDFAVIRGKSGCVRVCVCDGCACPLCTRSGGHGGHFYKGPLVCAGLQARVKKGKVEQGLLRMVDVTTNPLLLALARQGRTDALQEGAHLRLNDGQRERDSNTCLRGLKSEQATRATCPYSTGKCNEGNLTCIDCSNLHVTLERLVFFKVHYAIILVH